MRKQITSAYQHWFIETEGREESCRLNKAGDTRESFCIPSYRFEPSHPQAVKEATNLSNTVVKYCLKHLLLLSWSLSVALMKVRSSAFLRAEYFKRFWVTSQSLGFCFNASQFLFLFKEQNLTVSWDSRCVSTMEETLGSRKRKKSQAALSPVMRTPEHNLFLTGLRHPTSPQQQAHYSTVTV